MTVRTAVVIHGCHVGAKEWEHIVWGDPLNGVFGRIPRGIQVALSFSAENIFWGTGASERDGVKESEYIFSLALSRVAVLAALFGCSSEVLEGWIRKISILDRESLNTPKETERAMAYCRAHDIGRLILVSSPSHSPRCLQTGDVIRLQQKGNGQGVEVFTTSADTCYAGATIADTLIVEPPHRGDRPEVPIHRTLKDAMRIGRGDRAQEFNEALKRLISQFTSQ